MLLGEVIEGDHVVPVPLKGLSRRLVGVAAAPPGKTILIRAVSVRVWAYGMRRSICLASTSLHEYHSGLANGVAVDCGLYSRKQID